MFDSLQNWWVKAITGVDVDAIKKETATIVADSNASTEHLSKLSRDLDRMWVAMAEAFRRRS